MADLCWWPIVGSEAVANGAVTPARRTQRRVVELAANPAASRQALGISASQDAEIDRNAALLSASTLPAISRYSGVLYDALDVGSLRGAAVARARARLAVGSALFGLLRADDPVPACRLSATSKLPDRPTLAARWRPRLEPVLAEIARNELVVDGPAPTRRWDGCPGLSGSMSTPSTTTDGAPSSVISTRPTRVGWRVSSPLREPNRTTPRR
jgi:peroxide stress protein YaaA